MYVSIGFVIIEAYWSIVIGSPHIQFINQIPHDRILNMKRSLHYIRIYPKSRNQRLKELTNQPLNLATIVCFRKKNMFLYITQLQSQSRSHI